MKYFISIAKNNVGSEKIASFKYESMRDSCYVLFNKNVKDVVWIKSQKEE